MFKLSWPRPLGSQWWTLVLLVCRKEVFHKEQDIIICNYHWRGLWGPSFQLGSTNVMTCADRGLTLHAKSSVS